MNAHFRTNFQTVDGSVQPGDPRLIGHNISEDWCIGIDSIHETVLAPVDSPAVTVAILKEANSLARVSEDRVLRTPTV